MKNTSRLIQASRDSKKKYIIVATEKGIFYQMKKLSPDKIFLEAPTAGEGASCKSCGRCPWMQLNSLEKILSVFLHDENEIHIPKNIIESAQKSISRMVSFREKMLITKAS